MKKKTILSLLIVICLVCTAMLPGFAQETKTPEEAETLLATETKEDVEQISVDDLDEEPIALDEFNMVSDQPVARAASAADDKIGTFQSTVEAGYVNLHPFSLKESTRVVTQLTTSNADYAVVFFSINYATGTATQATNPLAGNTLLKVDVGVGDWAFGVAALGDGGDPYTLNYNNTATLSGAKNVYAPSVSKVYKLTSNSLYLNGTLQKTFVDRDTSLDIRLNESQSWSNPSGQRNSNNFYNYISDVKIDFANMPAGIFTYRRLSYKSLSYISSSAAIMIPIDYDTLFNFTFSQYLNGVNINYFTLDPYTYDQTPKRLTPADGSLATYLVYDIASGQVIDIMGKYNLIYQMGYVDPPTYSQIA